MFKAQGGRKMKTGMESRKTVTLYNLLFPIWILVWLPTPLWLLIIPGNYLIDRLVFTISAKKQKPKLEKKFFRKHTWKLFLFGFLADFIGSILLLIPLLIPVPDGVGKHYNQSFFGKFMNALQFNAFSNPAALLYTLFAIAVAGLLIYVFDKSVLMKTKEFEPEQAKKIAFLMAVITAPYLYLVPGQLFF